MLKITVSKDAHGIKLQSRNATRYVCRFLVGTVCETVALREVINAGRPNAAAFSPARPPAVWPAEHGDLEARVDARAFS
jgi:hypothetical protein